MTLARTGCAGETAGWLRRLRWLGADLQRSITVTPVPVASVTLARDTATLVAGATLQLSATARNASGAAIPGAEITWSSLNAGRATVSGTGLVTTLATGSARIVAASNGKKDTATITVLSRTAAEIELEPAFATANVGAQTALTLTVLTAAGLEVPGPVVNWSIPDGGTRTATSFSSVAAGRFRVGAQVDAIADTAVIAVLGPSSILVTAWPGSTFSSQRARGATFTVPVVIDMTRASATGDLGSFQMDLSYDPAVLQYVSNTPKASGTLDVNGAGAGLVRIAFAHTGAQGSGKFTLVNLTFRVRADAAVGRRQAFEISAPVRPSSSSFTLYQPVVGVGGTVRVVSP